MDKRIIYGVGGVALVGIAYYLYSKSKNDTRSGTDITPPDMSMGNGGSMSMGDATMGSVVAVRPSTPSDAGAINPTPIILTTTPSGNTATIGSGSGAYSLNPNNTSTQVVIDKVTTGTTPSTSDVTAFVDPASTTPKVNPYSPYVVGSNIYYYGGVTLFTNDVNAILSNNAIPLSQKTTAINVLRQLALDSIVSNVAIYGNLLSSITRTGALNSVNSISDSAIAQVQSEINALITAPKTTTTTTTTTTPILTRGFDGGFSYADGRRFRSRRNSLRGFVNATGVTTTALKTGGSRCSGADYSSSTCPVCNVCMNGICRPLPPDVCKPISTTK